MAKRGPQRTPNEAGPSTPKRAHKDGPRIAANGYRLPDPLPFGEVLTDNTKNQWIIGNSIGCGGFGEIYAAKPASERTDLWNYVVKVDHQNGPLYAEMYFYHRVAKEESIRNWMRVKRLDFLGMPRYIASGIHERKAAHKPKGSTSDRAKYRFLVIQRFGDDLQKKLEELSSTFDLKTTYTISKKVIDILEYIHSFGYIHADVKASNLLLGRSFAPTPKGKGLAEQNGIHSEVWLVDFGLVEKYRNSEGQHRGEEEDLRRANNGTVEFSSRDAHIGALCRRSDLEILGFNILSWLSGGRLPWMSNLKDHKYVFACKKYYMDRLHELFNFAFGKKTEVPPAEVLKDEVNIQDKKKVKKPPAFDRKKLTVKVPAGIIEYFQYIVNLNFAEDPDYGLLKDILSRAIIKEKGAHFDDGRFFFKKLPAKTVAKITSRLKRSSLSSPGMGKRKPSLRNTSEDSEEDDSPKPRARARSPAAAVAKGKQKAVITGKGRVPLKSQGVRSKSVSPIKSPSMSAPTSINPHKANDHSPFKSPSFEKPTPAMLAVMARLKEKQKQQNGATSTRLFQDDSRHQMNGSPVNGMKRGVGRPPKTPHARTGSTSSSKASSSPDSSPEKRKKTPTKTSVRGSGNKIVDGRKLSSNSSTHSTKENKNQPRRKSPRGK